MIPILTANFPLRFDPQLPGFQADTLKKMVRIWGGKGSEAKNACIRLIENGLANPAYVKAALTRLDPVDRAALAIVKERGGMIEAGELTIVLQTYGYQAAEENNGYYAVQNSYVSGLVRRGYLLPSPGNEALLAYSFNYYNQGIDGHIPVFCDERLLAQVDWPIDVVPMELPPAAPPPAATCRRPQNVVLDLMTVLQKLWEMKQLQLTKNGMIRAADYRQFAKKMGWGDDLITDGQCFPRVADAIIATLVDLRAFTRKENAIELALPLDRFLTYSPAHQVTFFLAGLLRNSQWVEYDEPQSYMPNWCNARIALLHALRALPDRTQYYSLQALLPALYDRVGMSVSTAHAVVAPPRYFYGKTEKQAEEEKAAWQRQHRAQWPKQEMPFYAAAFSSWLYWLGLVELATPDGKQTIFRLTDLAGEVFDRNSDEPAAAMATAAPSAGPIWVVQPNYDVVVYLDNISPQQLAFIERHGERKQAEAHTAHYILTRESIYQGLQTGTTIEEVLATLRDGAQVELPQNVERELREWAERREQLSIQTKTRLIEFPSSKTRDLALQAGLKGRPIGELFVMVEPGAQIKAALKSVFGLQTIPEIDYAQPPHPCLLVAEDGTLTQTGDTRDLLLKGQLAQYAEPVSANRWRITTASLQAARQAGVNAKTFLAFLTPRTTVPVPPLLEVAIRNALGKGSEVQGGNVFVLHIKEKKLYTAITTSLLLKPLIRDVPGPDTIVIDPDKLKEFKKQLEWLGIKLTAYAPDEDRPDWLQTLRDAKAQERRKGWW